MYSPDLIQQTHETFEPRYGRPLTQGEKEEILDNLRGFADILIEMYQKDKEHKQNESLMSIP
jgi:lantibiotic modifying enzyme